MYNEKDIGVERLLHNVFVICSPLFFHSIAFLIYNIMILVQWGAPRGLGQTHVIKSEWGSFVSGDPGCLFDPFLTPFLTLLLGQPGRLESSVGEMRSVWAAADPPRGAGAWHRAHFEGRGSNDLSLL